MTRKVLSIITVIAAMLTASLAHADNDPAFFRMGAILQGVKKRALDGNASNDKAKQLGGMTAPLAQMGVQVVEQGA